MPNDMSLGSSQLLAVSAPPFWHCGRTITKSMYLTVLALLPAAIMAVYTWGLPALRVMSLSVAVAVCTEELCSRLMHRTSRTSNFSAVVTGLLFSFLLPAASPWWLVAFGSFLCIAIGKMAFGGLGSSPLSPALVGWAALFISWPLLMNPNAVELNTTLIDPLVRLKFFGVSSVEGISTLDLIFGQQLGALGASQTGLLLLGGMFLCARGVVRWEISVSFVLGLLVTAAIFQGVNPEQYASPIFHLFTGSTILGAFFLATEASCSPNRVIPMVLYGLTGGVLVMLIRNFGVYTDGVPFAILLINLLMPQLENIRPKPFGAK